MPHGSPHDCNIIDAEFRVIAHSRLETWMAQLPTTRDRFALTCNAIAPFALLGGLLLGFFHLAFFAAVLLCAVGCLVSTEWKRYGIAGLLLAGLLATTSCQPLATNESASATLAHDRTKMPEELQASIREATRYRDPRQDLPAKKIDVINGDVEATNAKDVNHEAR